MAKSLNSSAIFFGKPASRLQNWLFPLALIILYSISFGWALPSLGYYLDDWPHIYYQKLGGSESVKLFHVYDGRPFLSWFYIFSSDLLGFTPFYWQIFALVLRFLTVIVFWQILRLLWGKSSWQVDAIALLFSVYPIFAQQPVSVAFSSHWAAFLCLLLSFYFMFLAIANSNLRIPLTFLSVSFAILQYSLSEYFIAIDFLRFLLIYFYGINNNFKKSAIREQVLWVFRHSLVYLMVWSGFVFWRVFLLELPTPDRIAPVLIQDLWNSPISSLQKLFTWIVKDFSLNLIISWYKTFTVDIFDFQSRFVTILLISTLLIFILCSLFLKWKDLRTDNNSSSWVKQGLIIGFLFILIAPLPSWVTGRSSSMFVGPMSDRFGLPAMFGASILLVALVDFLIRKTNYRILILAFLIGLATAWQARNTNDFRWAWIFQRRFYHQLYLRVPYLEPNSVVSSEQEFLPKVGGYPLSYALNILYSSRNNTETLEYYYINLSKEYLDRLDDYSRGELIFRQRWQSKFLGNTTEGIVIDYQPEAGRCLWVLDGSEINNPLLPEISRKVLSASDLSRIHHRTYNSLEVEIFDKPSRDSWCYFYQQAALAAQYQNWDEILELWRLSQPYHQQINASVELKPFIQAYLHKGDWESAFELSQLLNRGIRGGAIPYLCSIWEDSLQFDEYSLVKRFIEEWECEFLDRKN